MRHRFIYYLVLLLLMVGFGLGKAQAFISNDIYDNDYYNNDGCLSSSDGCNDDEEANSGGGALLFNYIQITSPNGGEILGKNSNAFVTETMNNSQTLVTWQTFWTGIESVDILYSTDLGVTWQEVVTHYPNTGYYNWLLPNIDTNTAMLRMNSYDGACLILDSDLTNAPFVILNHTQEVDPNLLEDGYHFKLIGQNIVDPIASGKSTQLEVTVLNTGTSIWYNNGDYPIHLATYNPADRDSVFVNSTWLNFNRPANMKETVVYPGEIGTFKFTIDANPAPGTYHESFSVVAEGLTWMTDQTIDWNIEVI